MMNVFCRDEKRRGEVSLDPLSSSTKASSLEGKIHFPFLYGSEARSHGENEVMSIR